MQMKVADDELLALCLTGKSQRQIADTLGMTTTQINRRVNTPEFQMLLSEFRHKILDGIVSSLIAESQKAVATLAALLDDENSFCRLQAASKILSLAQDFTIQYDILTEIRQLKEKNTM